MTLAKVNVGAVGEGLGTDIPVHVYSVATGVDTHLTEIHTKPWLHVGTHSVWQGTATSFTLTDLSFNIGSCLEAFSQHPRIWPGSVRFRPLLCRAVAARVLCSSR